MAAKKTTTKKTTTKKTTTVKKATPKKASTKKATARTAAAKKNAGKLSQLDAAARVLAEAGESMNTRPMVEAMRAKGYWKSPGGKTPHATLYSALIREIATRGKDARFKKTDRGQFTLKQEG